MGILENKKLLVTGVLTDDSFGFHAARRAIEEGAEIVLSGFGRGLSLTERTARRLPVTPDVLEIDVTNSEHLAAAEGMLRERFGRLDGLVHSIAFAPESCLGHGMFASPWSEVATALEASAYSLKSLTEAMLPLFEIAGGGSVVGFDFDAAVAWPGYDWMGVAKAALESLSRYLARDLGGRNIRVNLVSSGPLRTMAAKSIPGFSTFEDAWGQRAPLGWDVTADHGAPANACVALLSDLFSRTTGEIIHVDGGYHAVGA
ncbi:MAG TPA: enoyl-ACP reductase FabI [Acidimicrobiales bacterium]|nr:enoyl-ACP reductase FabI [Acidimicrobiales bacterium]